MAKLKGAVLSAAAGRGAGTVATMASRDDATPVTHAELAALVAIVERLVDRQQPVAPPAAATWVTLQQASEMLGLSDSLLRRLVREGKLRGLYDRGGCKGGNGVLKMRRADVEGLDL